MKKQIYLSDYPELRKAHELAKHLPNALIAGGAPRDILLGRQFKDIDIFVPTETSRNQIVVTASAIFKSSSPACFSGDSSDSGGYDDVFIVCNVENVFVWPHPYIDDPQAFVRNNDIRIGEAWMIPTEDGFDVHSTDLSDECLKHGVFGHVCESSNHKSAKQLLQSLPGILKEMGAETHR